MTRLYLQRWYKHKASPAAVRMQKGMTDRLTDQNVSLWTHFQISNPAYRYHFHGDKLQAKPVVNIAPDLGIIATKGHHHHSLPFCQWESCDSGAA